MPSMNEVTIIGHVGNSELKSFDWGTILDFSIATQHSYKDKATNEWKSEKAIWWNCKLFGKYGEAMAKSVTKGKLFYARGTMKQREHNDKIYSEIHIDKLVPLSPSEKAQQGQQTQANQKQQTTQETTRTTQSFGSGNAAFGSGTPTPTDLDNIPF